ncbi:unnamed protein product [Spirodela intermedia]|uniref:Uncharacterized protein n=1 Tax=Spirodela intermedia TaxID=51605 RepID=A0ABN7EDJ2_SPIIN|nr:unnamed protein product [Spirodela intermedia]
MNPANFREALIETYEDREREREDIAQGRRLEDGCDSSCSSWLSSSEWVWPREAAGGRPGGAAGGRRPRRGGGSSRGACGRGRRWRG